MIAPEYLGDGAYARFDGNVVLTTEDGTEITNQIVLEPDVWRALVSYVARIQASPDCPPIWRRKRGEA